MSGTTRPADDAAVKPASAVFIAARVLVLAAGQDEHDAQNQDDQPDQSFAHRFLPARMTHYRPLSGEHHAARRGGRKGALSQPGNLCFLRGEMFFYPRSTGFAPKGRHE
jgi:hypothetical protein